MLLGRGRGIEGFERAVWNATVARAPSLRPPPRAHCPVNAGPRASIGQPNQNGLPARLPPFPPPLSPSRPPGGRSNERPLACAVGALTVVPALLVFTVVPGALTELPPPDVRTWSRRELQKLAQREEGKGGLRRGEALRAWIVSGVGRRSGKIVSSLRPPARAHVPVNVRSKRPPSAYGGRRIAHESIPLPPPPACGVHRTAPTCAVGALTVVPAPLAFTLVPGALTVVPAPLAFTVVPGAVTDAWSSLRGACVAVKMARARRWRGRLWRSA